MYLVGERIRLRNIELTDVSFVKNIENDPENWEFSSTLAPYSSYSVEEYIKSEFLGIYQNKQQRFVIELKENKTAIGLIDLFNYDPQNATSEIGIFINKNYRNKKYGKESLEILLHYAFNHIDIKTIIITISTDNISSIKLFESSKFEKVGIIKSWKKWMQTRKDVVIMQVTNK